MAINSDNSSSVDHKFLVKYDGEINGSTPGWEFLQSKEGEMVQVPFEGVYESKGGRIQSPIIKLNEALGKVAYYNLKFNARTLDQCYWWVDFFDEHGNALPDVNSAVYPDCKSNDYDQMIYVQADAVSLRLAFQSNSGVIVRDITLEMVSHEEASRWCDELYEQLPPLKFTPDKGCCEFLPQTANALKAGTPWRVVMLGDSIQNDSFNSVFQALVKRDFPQSNFDFIPSVRGSTGCWHYQEPKCFEEYVARHKPDLLMIGGISNIQKESTTANIATAMKNISLVIQQARAIGCEIVLLSPPHSVDWRSFNENTPHAPLPSMTWKEDTPDAQGRMRLLWSPYKKLADKEGIDFWNLTVPVIDYIATSQKCHNYFNRDHIHNNDRGKQIIGRVLHKYFLATAAP